MAKYTIYDGKSNVMTPIGEILSPEEWYSRYPWGRVTKMIVGGGVINGSMALIFDDFVNDFKKAGCDFSDCTTDEEILAKIEDFEDNPPVINIVSDQTRIADALEDIAAQNLPDADTYVS